MQTSPPDDWLKLTKALPPELLGKMRQARLAAEALDDAELAAKFGPKGTWYVSEDGGRAVVAALSGSPSGSESGSPTGLGSGSDPDATGWREALARADAEADRLRAELATERVARQEAVRRAEEAERARHSAELRQARLSGAWATWYATVRGLTWWRRRRLPDPPAETGQGLLNPPPAS